MRLFSLALAALLFAPAAFAQPGQGGKGMGRGMRHATPMPNLMRVIVMKGGELNLTKAQDEAFAKWRAEAHGPSMALGAQIAKHRKAIREMAYGDADAAAMTKEFEAMAAAQAELTAAKIKCRDVLKTTLTPSQWTTLVALHKQMGPGGKGMGRGAGKGMGRGAGKGMGRGAGTPCAGKAGGQPCPGAGGGTPCAGQGKGQGKGCAGNCPGGCQH